MATFGTIRGYFLFQRRECIVFVNRKVRFVIEGSGRQFDGGKKERVWSDVGFLTNCKKEVRGNVAAELAQSQASEQG